MTDIPIPDCSCGGHAALDENKSGFFRVRCAECGKATCWYYQGSEFAIERWALIVQGKAKAGRA